MHGEAVEVTERLCDEIERHGLGAARGGVGTTCVRALETASRAGRAAPWSGTSHLFIRPGFEFRCVDALLTNFHQPALHLAAARGRLCGPRAGLGAYRHAVAKGYRFLSYGDAMFLPSGRAECSIRILRPWPLAAAACPLGSPRDARRRVPGRGPGRRRAVRRAPARRAAAGRNPGFMPVGTRATVKAVDPGELRASGTRILVSNTFHLMLRPGSERVRAHGGCTG